MPWKEYLSFTKRERNGVVILVALILLAAVMPSIFPATTITYPAAVPAYPTDEGKTLASPGPPGYRRALTHNDPDEGEKSIAENTASERRVWKEDDKPLRERPYYRSYNEPARRWRENAGSWKNKKPQQEFRPHYSRQNGKSGFFSRPPLDINKADSLAFEELPGIGPKLAARIVFFREKLGGFHQVRQVKEVYGLPDSTYTFIAGRLVCHTGDIQKQNINTASAEQLWKHPYLRGRIAASITHYRKQHGPFRSLEEIRKIASLPPESLEKILPYLSLE